MNDVSPELSAVVTKLAEEIFEVPPAVIGLESNLESDLGATSITRLEFLVAIERHLNVELDPLEFGDALTISDVLRVLGQRAASA